MDHPHGQRLAERLPPAGQGAPVFRSMLLDPCGPVEVGRSGRRFEARGTDGAEATFTFDAASCLQCHSSGNGTDQTLRLGLATIEAIFAAGPEHPEIKLSGSGWNDILPQLLRIGVAVPAGDRHSLPRVVEALFWQHSFLWMNNNPALFPRLDVVTGHVEHPLRPPQPQSCLYRRFIPWLSGALSFEVACVDDLPLLHRWMNDPRIDEFWNEAGPLSHHERYLARMMSDAHVIPLIGRFEGRPFSYFEIYWAKEDLIGTYAGAGDYDRGCHVIVGDEAFRGKAWFTAWLPSLVHLMFLDDGRTERVVQEPSAMHHRQLRNLQLSGFSHARTADMPGKRAAIMTISRQHFFCGRFWHPRENAG